MLLGTPDVQRVRAVVDMRILTFLVVQVLGAVRLIHRHGMAGLIQGIRRQVVRIQARGAGGLSTTLPGAIEARSVRLYWAGGSIKMQLLVF